MFHTSQVVMPPKLSLKKLSYPAQYIVKPMKGNAKLLVMTLELYMKQQERKMVKLRWKNKCLTSVLSSRTVKRLKERISRRDWKVTQLKERITTERRRAIYQTSIYRARAINTRKVDHDGVIGQLVGSENTIMELQETIEIFQTPSHTIREGIFPDEMLTTVVRYY